MQFAVKGLRRCSINTTRAWNPKEASPHSQHWRDVANLEHTTFDSELAAHRKVSTQVLGWAVFRV